jgi:hypothetical protein
VDTRSSLNRSATLGWSGWPIGPGAHCVLVLPLGEANGRGIVGPSRWCWFGQGVGKAGWSAWLVRTLLSGRTLSRAGEAANRAGAAWQKGRARAESGRPASKGACRRRPVAAANGRRGRRLLGALLARDWRRRRERVSRGAALDWGRMPSATDGRGSDVCERERAPQVQSRPGQVSGYDSDRKRKRISGCVLTFSINAEKEDKSIKIYRSLRKI